MKTRMSFAAALALGIASACAGALSVSAIYRDGNLLAWSAALLFPIVGLLAIYRDFGKRVLAALFALLPVSAITWAWLALGDQLGSFALITVVLVGLLAPLGLDLLLIDRGTRLVVGRRLAQVALGAFIVAFAPLAAVLVRHEHRVVVAGDQALLREIGQHVSVYDNWLVFENVDPKRKSELKNRLAVRSEGKTYPLADAHFESTSSERTVRKQTENRGTRRTTLVTAERNEQLRVVVDVEHRPTTNIVLYSTRGPLTICEQEIWLPDETAIDDPVS